MGSVGNAHRQPSGRPLLLAVNFASQIHATDRRLTSPRHFLKLEPWGHYSFFRSFVTIPFLNQDPKALNVVQYILESCLLRREKNMRDKDGKLIVDLPPKTVCLAPFPSAPELICPDRSPGAGLLSRGAEDLQASRGPRETPADPARFGGQGDVELHVHSGHADEVGPIGGDSCETLANVAGCGNASIIHYWF